MIAKMFAIGSAALMLAGLTAPTASADKQSFLDAVHAQGITSEKGDDVIFAYGSAACKLTATYLRIGGDWAFFGARRKAAEDIVNDNLHRPRNDSIVVTNAAIDHLCPQYNHTWAAV
jgi:hypothetical protein